MGFFGYSSVSFTAGWTAPAISFQSCTPQKANGIRKLPTLLAYTERVIYRREEIKEEVATLFLRFFLFFPSSLFLLFFSHNSLSQRNSSGSIVANSPPHTHTHTLVLPRINDTGKSQTHTRKSLALFFFLKKDAYFGTEIIYFQNKVGIKIRIVRTRTHARWM